MSHRVAQIESTLKRAISEVLTRQLSDPRIAGLVSVTRVKVSPDLKDAYVYVSVLPEHQQKKTLYGLRHAAGHIQSLLRKAVAMKSVPHLDFRLDESLKKQAEVFGAIRRAEEREAQEAQQRPEAAAPPELPNADVPGTPTESRLPPEQSERDA